tara:strand:- start:188045 stop:188557 length:513 start_codon:yes stop_codon:yes gene_type:complete
LLILVAGLTGAGKTTYCQKYCKENKAKLFSIDNWMKALYWQDMPANPDMNWFVQNQKWYTERIARCEKLIEAEVVELFKAGVDVLLDFGFTSAEHRAKYLALARDNEQGGEIHFLDVDPQTRWSRVQSRNKNKGSTYSMEVTREMFDYMENVFEPFTNDEKQVLTTISLD